jgi:hypothetical protein
MSPLFKAYLDIDSALAKHGVHRTSPVWLKEIERFYAHPTARLLVAMVGRGGVKSVTSCKMALAETLSGDWRVPPGEMHFYTHISENVSEAKKTQGILERYLRFLGVAFDKSENTLTMRELPLGFKILAARVGGVSGWRAFAWTADENAKWNDGGVDPSGEVLSSIRAMTVTHPNARGRMFSSPLGTSGEFHDTWKLGDTDEQTVCQYPTWIANPSVTEEQTKKLERNPDKWRREYAAIPIEGNAESLFSAEMIRRALRPQEDRPAHVQRKTPTADNFVREHPWAIPPEPGVTYTAAMDPALSRNTWAFVIAGRRRCKDGRVRRSIVFAKEWTGSRDRPLDPFVVLGEIATILREYDLLEVRTDQHHGTSLQAIANRSEIDIYVRVEPATQVSNLAGYESMYTQLADGEIELPDYGALREDLLGVRRVVTGNGISVKLDSVGDRHSDFAPAVSKAIANAKAEPEVQGPAAGSPAALKLEEQRCEADLIARLERSKQEASDGNWWSADGRAAGFDL